MSFHINSRKCFWQTARTIIRQMDRPPLPASLLTLCYVRSNESLRLLCKRGPSCLINRLSNKKLSPVQMRTWLGEPIDMFLLKQVLWIYRHSGRGWSHLKPVFKCACVFVSVADREVGMDSLPPCGHHNSSLCVIHAGSCSAKWDFLGDYSL